MSTDRKMNALPKPAWHELAEQATREDDGDKLCRLVEEICNTIDAARAAKKRPPQTADTAATPTKPVESPES
jgi:hypothetical protein